MDNTKHNIRQLIPCIKVKDVRNSMEYYICELGFKPRYYLGGVPESGGVEINGISIDFISGEMESGDVSLNFLVDDVDKLYTTCSKRTLDIILEPRTTNGMRLFGIKDPNQYKLFFYNWIDRKETSVLMKKNQEKEIPERFKCSIMKVAVEAVRDGDIELLKKFLSIESSIVFERAQDINNINRCNTLLHILTDPVAGSLNDNSAEIANMLIRAGSEIDSLDRTEAGLTPLQLLLSKPVKSPHVVNVASVLIEAGARIADPYKSEQGLSAFQFAILNGHTATAKLMLPNLTRPGFVWIAGLGDPEAVKCFFAHRDSEEFKNNSGYFLLEETSTNYIPEKNMSTLAVAYILACINGQFEVVSFLLDKGVDINVMVSWKNFMGIAASGLHWAAFHGHDDTVKLLLKAGANLIAQDNCYSLTPAAWAAKGGNYELSKYLKRLERNINISG